VAFGTWGAEAAQAAQAAQAAYPCKGRIEQGGKPWLNQPTSQAAFTPAEESHHQKTK
jgi:hypothetical protein